MLRPRLTNTDAYRWGAAGLFLAVAAILTALAFEHIGGMRPCALCYQQRWAYYAGIPVLFLALVLLTSGRPQLALAAFGLVALAFLANAGLGVQHVPSAGTDQCIHRPAVTISQCCHFRDPAFLKPG